MKALRFHARGVVTVDEVDEPKLVDGWTIVAPTFSGICGTDVKQYKYGPFGISDEPHPLSGAQLPLTLGHEIGGVIVETSSSDSRLVAGSRVAVDGSLKCGTCWYCQHGHYVLCEQGAILGISAHGGLAELVAVPNYALHLLPDELSDEEGALVEPVSVATHAVRRLGLQAGDSVCVVGGGVIGLCIMQVARASGARTVGVVEPIAERRSVALELGADFAVVPPLPDDVDAQAEINAHFSGLGADVSFDCVGSGPTLAIAINSTRRAGRVGLVGTHVTPPQVDVSQVTGTEKELIGTVAYEDDFPRAIGLIRDHRVQPARLVTAKVPLDRAVADGIMQLAEHPERQIKILVRPR